MSGSSGTDSEKPKRRRQTAESARRSILDAAGRRLTREGPDGLRLQSIAADLGISHSSILHHFGSREGLLEALSRDAFDALDRDLRATLDAPEAATQDDDRAGQLLERIAETLGDQGHARLLAWQLISGRAREETDEDGNGMLARIADSVHRVRLDFAQAQNLATPDLEDTRFFILLMAYSLFGEALSGDLMATDVGVGADAAMRKRFRTWLAHRSHELILPKPAADEN